MKGTTKIDAPRLTPRAMLSLWARLITSWYAEPLPLNDPSALTKSWCEWVAKRKPRITNARTWKMTRHRMTCAIRRSEKMEPSPTITRKGTEKMSRPGGEVTWMHCVVLVMFAAALVGAELLNARR